ncbi:BlaI/MecI/CopY family transcriptional regulator, partial [bacterium]|nr:BlaI/MecI/CopY family transcriptional regulator [bacterium]
MARNPSQELSKRERQIMDIIYMLGEATAAEILEYLPEEVGDASARKLIRIVEQKGYL